MDFPKQWLKDDSLGELISSDLRLKIINGTIPRDTVLTENQISAEFKTSRSPVREAIKILSTEGLVTLGRMGVVVKGLEKEDLQELYDVRFLLEQFCLLKMIDDFENIQAEKYYQIIDFMELSEKHQNFMDFAFQDLEFHETIIKEAGHKRILYLWNNIRDIVLCLMLVATEKRFKEDHTEVKQVLGKHRQIIDALVNRDKKKINELIEAHFNDTQITVVGAYINNQN